MVMVQFDIIPGLNFNFLSFTLIIIHYLHNQKQRKMKFKPNVKLNHNRIEKKTHNFQYDWYVHVPCNKVSTFSYFKFEAHNLKSLAPWAPVCFTTVRILLISSNVVVGIHTYVMVNLIFGSNFTLLCF